MHVKAHTEPTTDLPPNLLITVCAACLQASCWQGEFYCEQYKTANTTELTVKRLRALAREHPDYWEHDPHAVHWRRTGKMVAR